MLHYLHNSDRNVYIGPFGTREKAEAYQANPIPDRPDVGVSFVHVTTIVSIQDVPNGSECYTPERGPAGFWGNGFYC